MFLIEADCEYDVWGSGSDYLGIRSVTGGARQNDEVWEGVLIYFLLTRMLR
jgi:hypothetical protein